MKAFLISDNIDTQMGMRLCGIDGVVVHEREEVEIALENAIANPEYAVILLTTKIVELIPEEIAGYKLKLSKPLLCEIPDRHGNSKIGETIDAYISDAIGVKL